MPWVTPAVTEQRRAESSIGVTRTGRPARWTAGSPDGPGRPAASIATTTPRTSATPIVEPRDAARSTSVRPPARTTISAADDEPEHDAEQRPGETEDPASTTTDPPDLAAGHPGRTQDADLADALDDVHGQRVDDARARRSSTATTASASNSPKIRASASLDRALRCGRAGRPRGRARGGCGRRRVAGRRPAHRARSARRRRRRPATPKTRRRVGPADQHGLAGPARDRSLDDAGHAQVEAASRPPAAHASGPGRRSGRAGRPGWPAGSWPRRRRAPASAAFRSPAMKWSRPSSARSEPTTAAASVRTPSRATSKVAIGLTRSTPGTSPVRSASTPSSAEIGRIEVTTSSPGMTSAIQPAAAARACCPTPPSATIIARPMVSPPTVSAVRLRSRTTEPRASRSSRRRRTANGRPPAIRATTGSTNGMSRVATSRTP